MTDIVERLCAVADATGPNDAKQIAYQAADEITRLREESERLREALRLIELIGYREGEQAGWMVAHMRGVANDALEGRTSEHIWRLFPHHRAALNHGKDRGEAP